MKKFILLLLCILLLSASPVEAGSVKDFFKTGLTKAREVMQGLFQMTFLPSVPVLLHKDHFNTMFDYTNKSIENIDREYNGEQVTRNRFQDDKALHIKKSAELALHIQSLIGSAHLAYGITLAIGAVKEVIDGSFLNPNGSRSMADFHADKVGASAVFGKEKFDKKLDAYMGSFVKSDAPINTPNITQDDVSIASGQHSPPPAMEVPLQSLTPISAASAENRQELMRKYYKAVNEQDTATMQEVGKLLQAQ